MLMAACIAHAPLDIHTVHASILQTILPLDIQLMAQLVQPQSSIAREVGPPQSPILMVQCCFALRPLKTCRAACRRLGARKCKQNDSASIKPRLQSHAYQQESVLG